jgi:tetratricopeptide (TPR) repeat protein
MNPSDADGYSNKGLSLHGLKEYDESLKFYKKSIELNPNDPFTYNNVGILLKSLKKIR